MVLHGRHAAQATVGAQPEYHYHLGWRSVQPSAIGTAQYEGDRLAGRQMVDVLNHFELDYATFGNHEFDVKENQFNQRMKEAKFTWVSSNVFAADGQPYAGVKQNLVIPVTDKKAEKPSESACSA